jgi:hypothetical protein
MSLDFLLQLFLKIPKIRTNPYPQLNPIHLSQGIGGEPRWFGFAIRPRRFGFAIRPRWFGFAIQT